MYIQITPAGPVECSLTEVRQSQNVSMRDDPSDEALAAVGVFRAVDAPRPQDDAFEVTGYGFVEVAGVWHQVWDSRRRSPSEMRERAPGLTQRQFRLALIRCGYVVPTPGEVEAASPPGQEAENAVEWEYGDVLYRTAPVVSAVGAALGISEDQMDAIFLAGSGMQQ